MAVTLHMKRMGRALFPADGVSEEAIYTLPSGVELKATVTQPRRSEPQLRLYWAVLSLVASNMDGRVTKEALHEWLKLQCGIVERIQLRSGAVLEVPGSIGFDSMDQHEFQSYFDQAMDVICESLAKVGRDQLLVEAQEMLGLPAPAEPAEATPAPPAVSVPEEPAPAAGGFGRPAAAPSGEKAFDHMAAVVELHTAVLSLTTRAAITRFWTGDGTQNTLAKIKARSPNMHDELVAAKDKHAHSLAKT